MPSDFEPEADIRNGVRDWLRTASVPFGDPVLTAKQVIPANDKGNRPPLPYMTVLVSVLGAEVSTDADVPSVDGGGAPQIAFRGQRTATVSVQGYGTRTASWMAQAVLRLRGDDIAVILGAAGLTVRPVTPLTNLTAVLDTGPEGRYSQDFAIDYAHQTEPVPQTEMLSVEAGVTLTSDVGPDITFTVVAP